MCLKQLVIGIIKQGKAGERVKECRAGVENVLVTWELTDKMTFEESSALYISRNGLHK